MELQKVLPHGIPPHYIKTKISNNKDLILFPIGKTGTMSMVNTFKMDVVFLENNKEFDKLLNNNNNVKIITIRDPIKRILSQYYEICRPREETKDITINMEFYKLLKEKEYKKSFLSFLNELINGNIYDNHLLSQVDQLELYGITMKNINEKINHVLITDKLNDEIALLQKTYKLKKHNIIVASGSINNKDIDQYFKSFLQDREIKTQIEKLYEKDIILYNLYK